MDNYQLAQKFADLESGFQRLLGEYQQLVARQVSLAARMDRIDTFFKNLNSRINKKKNTCPTCLGNGKITIHGKDAPIETRDCGRCSGEGLI